MKKALPVILIIVAAVIAGYLYKKYRIAPGIKFETLQLEDVKGNPVNLSDYHDKKVFLNFFQSWCGPCIGEIPALDNAAESMASDNFIFVCISDESPAIINRVKERLNTRHIIFLHSNKKLKELGVFTYPTSYLLNAKGNVVFEKIGEQDWSQPEVMQLLKQKAN